MEIRKAEEKDCPVLLTLLSQISRYHYLGRPDIFRADSSKYSLQQVKEMIASINQPIFVAVDESDEVLGYAMIKIKTQVDHPVLAPFKVLYLDDLCVDEKARKSGIGHELMDHIKTYAKTIGCSRIELNVWDFPGSAETFYEENGFRVQRRGMEFWL
ncbi:GNAT family N-acetyltransferase [Lactococcus fujiensis]|uniref:Acetyltransferase n=1 Tax=Lactococcus fujiensis JCM 16395 TaxID=1291764 RepID=A0A2A5RKG3_9LACT|nr:GNAT family N-acetyltransferase [Lactococcus fujiensis]PCR99640.1 Acetyltransferase [Lactococcus fujiensis JCM 16395]